MHLPERIEEILKRLEANGHEAWVVGGCVRDSLLGIAPHDYDVCTSALPEQTQQVFADRRLVLAGLRHGTVGVITGEDVVEITTFRTEGAYTDSRHPGWVRFVPDIREDLARRDFTGNAMAFSPVRGFADPFGGQQDLQKRILRAVGDPEQRFEEDALRILRAIRFAARFHLQVEEHTWQAMVSHRQKLDAIARERVMDEMTEFLCRATHEDLLRFQPIVAQVIPQLAPAMGFDQHSPHHAYDVYTHTALVAGGVPPQPVLRWAGLLHDVGKPACFSMGSDGRGHFWDHAKAGAGMADEILRSLRASTALREEVCWLIAHHMDCYPQEPKVVRRLLSRWGRDRVERLLTLQMADLGGKGVRGDEDTRARLRAFRLLVEETVAKEGELTLRTLAVRGGDLMEAGYKKGPELGKALNRLLELVLAGKLPNDREILLNQAKAWL